MNKLPVHVMKKGPFKGQQIDNRTRRTLEITEETEEHYFANFFFHRGEFFSAKIPKNSLKAIIGQRFSFSSINPFVTHTQVRLLLKDNQYIELYSLEDENQEVLYKLQDFVYSIEVVGPKGEAWSFANSFGAFVSAHRMLSIEEVVFERITLGGYTVIQSPHLLLNQEKLDRALELILNRCNTAGVDERYYLVTALFGARNCTSEVFRLLDTLIKNDYSWLQRMLSKTLWRFPIALRTYLDFRGAVKKGETAPTLNEEFQELSVSDDYQQRVDEIKRRGITIVT